MGGMAKAEEVTPTMSMTCCFQGVAPTMWPVLRSCMLSPEMDPAQAIMALT